MSQTVVLGWDGLDYELVNKFGYTNKFGPEVRHIKTFDNPHMEKPHTFELWPTIITGKHPDEHGIRANEGDTVKWANKYLNTLSAISSYVVPQSVRTYVGAKLRDHGAQVDQKTVDFYTKNGINTIFDEAVSKPISIPNYITERDIELGVEIERNELWQAAIQKSNLGEEVDSYQMNVQLDHMDDLLISRLGRKIGLVTSAMERDFELIFVWLPYLDSVGHLNPASSEIGWQHRHYELAARMTDFVRSQMAEDDTLVCVSDHGIQKGNHTYQAMIGSESWIVDGCNDLTDVRTCIEKTISDDGSDSVKESRRKEGSKYSETTDELKSNLEDLGYI